MIVGVLFVANGEHRTAGTRVRGRTFPQQPVSAAWSWFPNARSASAFLYRGNVITQTTLGKSVTRTYDITGNIKTGSDGNLQVASATGSASNYAVPTSMTPNGTGNLGVTYTYNGALEPTNRQHAERCFRQRQL